ncbi:outer membrane beta-barrel protein, partial [Thermodesulfobacteriota bacterium]
SYQNTADPYGSENTYNIGDQTERWNNAINMTAGYDFADIYTVEAYARNFVERYDLKADQYQDRTRNTVGGLLLYRLNKMQLLGELRRAAVAFDEQNDGIGGWDDNNSQDHALTEALFGFRFQPGGKIVGDAKLGYQTVSFENDEDKNGNNYNDDPSIIVEADVNYFLSERTSFNIFGGRNRNTSVTAGDIDDVSSSYINTYWGVGFTQKMRNKISLKAEFERNLEDYLDVSAGNDDKLLIANTLRGGVDYDINNLLDVGLTLSYKDKQSDTSQYEDEEYTVTQYGFYIELTY